MKNRKIAEKKEQETLHGGQEGLGGWSYRLLFIGKGQKVRPEWKDSIQDDRLAKLAYWLFDPL